ncbi:unnamed protein product [Sphagnum jensenii]|uniref:Uncharacterized protein n=1 Tax=Sphagnum jensenii TaxID=128206 RepID=A0ABP1AZR6_9BRYO
MAARMAKSWSSTTKQVFKICRNSGVPDTAATTAAQRAVVASNSSRLTSSVSSPSRSFKSLFETRRPASVFFRLPGELACVQSLLPLHSAVASARMFSIFLSPCCCWPCFFLLTFFVLSL